MIVLGTNFASCYWKTRFNFNYIKDFPTLASLFEQHEVNFLRGCAGANRQKSSFFAFNLNHNLSFSCVNTVTGWKAKPDLNQSISLVDLHTFHQQCQVMEVLTTVETPTSKVILGTIVKDGMGLKSGLQFYENQIFGMSSLMEFAEVRMMIEKNLGKTLVEKKFVTLAEEI